MELGKGALFDGAEQPQPVVPGLAFGQGHRPGVVRGRGVGALGIREDVQIPNGQLFQKAVGVQKMLLGFPGEAHNHVHANAGVGTGRQDAFHAFLVELPLVPTLHFSQDLVVSALEGDVEVGNEAFGGVRKVYDFVAEQIGLNGRNPDAVQAVDLVQGMQQVQKRVFVAFVAHFALAVVADVDAGQNHFLDALRHNALGVADHLFHGCRPANPAGQGDGAVGAFVVATVLHFQKGAGAVSDAVGTGELVHVLNFAGMDFRVGPFVQVLEEVREVHFLFGAQDQVHAFHGRYLTGLELRVASRNRHKRVGVGF